jgi:hypothetical protein
MPTFYDFSDVSAYPYPNGGYCLDNLITGKPRSQGTNANASDRRSGTHDQLRRMKQHIPLPVRSFVRERVDRLTSNPRIAGLTRPKVSK